MAVNEQDIYPVKPDVEIAAGRRVVTVRKIEKDYSHPMAPQNGEVTRKVVDREVHGSTVVDTVVSKQHVQTLRFNNQVSVGER